MIHKSLKIIFAIMNTGAPWCRKSLQLSRALLWKKLRVKCRGKFHPRTSNEGPERQLTYSSTLSLTSALEGVVGQGHAPVTLPPIWPGTQDGCRKPRHHWDSKPRPTTHSNLLYRLNYLGPPKNIKVSCTIWRIRDVHVVLSYQIINFWNWANIFE